MRRHGLVYLLIPAVLLAAAGLAYLGYQRSSQERLLILDTMRELAEEKVIGIESEINQIEGRLFDSVDIGNLRNLKELADPLPVESVLVLDVDEKIVPGGYVTKRADDQAFRELFEERIVKDLQLAQTTFGETRYKHLTYRGRDFLMSFTSRFGQGRTFYIVAEADQSFLLSTVFPQFFGVSSKRLYQVVDDEGQLVYGFPFRGIQGADVIEMPFPTTLTKWRLRMAQKDAPLLAKEAQRQATLNLILIAFALGIIVAGLWIIVAAMRRERRLNALKSEFISNVSHELKTPLSIISMFGELLSMGRVKSPEQATEYAEIIRRESVRLSRLIDNVLDFAKIERGADVYEIASDQDLRDIVNRSLELCRHRLERAELELEVDLDDNIPLVRMDGSAMTLAVLNLIDNAIKYGASGDRIEVSLHEIDGRVELTVKDYGPGIAEEEQEYIFDRFYRAKKVRLLPIRGSGIGLSLVRHIAHAHGGGIEVESTPGEGAMFRLWIPIGPGSKVAT